MKKPVSGFSIAFIDIMCCGLGALVFLFILIKDAPQRSNEKPQEFNLLREISELEKKRENLQTLNRRKNKQETIEKNKTSEIAKQIQYINGQIALNQRKIESVKKRVQAKSTISKILSTNVKADRIQLIGAGEEEYLIGLKVEGKKIAILLDSSSSMTNEKIIEILKTKNSSDEMKVSSHKWRRSVKVVLWLLARLPETSQYQIITYNDKAKSLRPIGWSPVYDSLALKATQLELKKLIPFGPTNFEKALKFASNENPSVVYVITDGLPTQGESGGNLLKQIRGCASFYKNKNVISGQCRLELFNRAIRKHDLSGVMINVILLPLEGDPGAAPAYVDWARKSGGMVISPASTWP